MFDRLLPRSGRFGRTYSPGRQARTIGGASRRCRNRAEWFSITTPLRFGSPQQPNVREARRPRRLKISVKRRDKKVRLPRVGPQLVEAIEAIGQRRSCSLLLQVDRFVVEVPANCSPVAG